MGKIISIVNQKGGVGKTTTAVNLAAAIGARGFRTLLVDIDPQGNSTSGMGVNKKSIRRSTYDILINDTPAAQAVMHSMYEHVDILPANIDLAGAELELADAERRESRLKYALGSVREQYDFIFLDCPPSLGLITINALCASDTFMVPIQCEYYALEGLSQLINTVRQVRRQLEVLRQEYAAEEATRRRAARLEELRDQAAGIRDAWPCLTQEERQTVIRDCVDRIVVNGPKVEIYYTFLQQDPKA